MKRAVLFSALLVSAFAGHSVSTRPAHAAAFDGSWSVLIITNQGECDRGYRYGVRIGDGKVAYEGTADIQLSGTVSSGGAVSVTVRRGSQSATGTGRISANSGSGTWRGRGPNGECSGNWEAERR